MWHFGRVGCRCRDVCLPLSRHEVSKACVFDIASYLHYPLLFSTAMSTVTFESGEMLQLCAQGRADSSVPRRLARLGQTPVQRGWFWVEGI